MKFFRLFRIINAKVTENIYYCAKIVLFLETNLTSFMKV